MWKKIWLAAVGVLWILAGIQVVQSHEADGTDKVLEVLGSVGIMEQSAVVEYEGVLLETVENEKAFLDEIVNKCGLCAEMYRYGSEGVESAVSVITAEGEIKLLTVLSGENEKQYLFADLKFQEGPARAFSVREAMEELLSSHARVTQSSVNVIGSYSGELTLEQRNRAADYLLQELDARIVSEHRGMDFFTIYGYTSHIEEYQLQKGEPVNVNIAMYYDEEQDRTYIYAAVPVIGVEY